VVVFGGDGVAFLGMLRGETGSREKAKFFAAIFLGGRQDPTGAGRPGAEDPTAGPRRSDREKIRPTLAATL
jgi:hypothetical protein